MKPPHIPKRKLIQHDDLDSEETQGKSPKIKGLDKDTTKANISEAPIVQLMKFPRMKRTRNNKKVYEEIMFADKPIIQEVRSILIVQPTPAAQSSSIPNT